MFITISFEVLESGRRITYLTLPQMKDSPHPPRLKTIEIGETKVLVDINRETGCVFGLELTDEDATYINQYLGNSTESEQVLYLSIDKEIIRKNGGLLGLWVAKRHPLSFIETHGVRLCFADPDFHGLLGIEYLDKERYHDENSMLSKIIRSNEL